MARKASYSRVLPRSTRSDQDSPPSSSFPSVENPFACEASVSCLSWFNFFVWIQVLRVIFRGRAFASPIGSLGDFRYMGSPYIRNLPSSIARPSVLEDLDQVHNIYCAIAIDVGWVAITSTPCQTNENEVDDVHDHVLVDIAHAARQFDPDRVCECMPVSYARISATRHPFIRTYVNVAPTEPCTWASLLPMATGKRVGMPGRDQKSSVDGRPDLQEQPVPQSMRRRIPVSEPA